MLFRFIGQYTHGRTTIDMGVLFEGREPSEVTDAELIRRLSANVEFEAVSEEAPVEAPVEAPKKRGRPKKVAE
jgi:hypothetical protein